MLVSEKTDHHPHIGTATTAQQSSTSSSQRSSETLPISSVPETIFGWPALFTAVQSILASLPFFKRLFVSDNLLEFEGRNDTPSCHQSTRMSTILEAEGQGQVASLTPGQLSPQMGSQSSSDITMLPVQQDHGGIVTAQSSSARPLSSMITGDKSVPKQGKAPALQLTSLPDELIAMCYADLSAEDLVALEHVSRRLRHLIAYDSVCWKRCTETRWGHLCSNSTILSSAAKHAGTWKHLYAEKAKTDAENIPWMTLCKSEMQAVLDVIKGEKASSPPPVYWPMASDDPVPSSPPKENTGPISSSSPCSIMTGNPPLACLSVVLLIDASSSVTDDDFEAMKRFARALVENLRASHPESAVAVVQFNQHPKVEVSLLNVRKPKLSASIENMEQLMGSTDIAAPIRKARLMLAEDAPPGDRAIVLLTDGQTHADELQESEREARKAFEEVGARLYTLGVGRDIDEVGLGRVASGSTGGMHFTLRRLVPSK